MFDTTLWTIYGVVFGLVFGIPIVRWCWFKYSQLAVQASEDALKRATERVRT